MWIKEGLKEFFSTADDHVVLGHSLPFRNAGASRNSGRSPELVAAAAAVNGKVTTATRKRKEQRAL